MRNLDQHTGTVARFGIAAACAAMLEMLECLDSLEDDFMRAAPADVGHEADTTGVEFATVAAEGAERWRASTHYRFDSAGQLDAAMQPRRPATLINLRKEVK